MPNQWAQSRQPSMSTWTQARKLLMPNQWVKSRQLSMSTWTQARSLSQVSVLQDTIQDINSQSSSIFQEIYS